MWEGETTEYTTSGESSQDIRPVSNCGLRDYLQEVLIIYSALPPRLASGDMLLLLGYIVQQSS